MDVVKNVGEHARCPACRCQDRVQLRGDRFNWARAGRCNGTAKAVLFVNLGWEIKTGSTGLGNSQVGGYGGKIS